MRMVRELPDSDHFISPIINGKNRQLNTDTLMSTNLLCDYVKADS